MQLWNNRPFLKTWKFSSAILANWINPTTVALLTAVMHDGISLWGPKDIFFGNKRSECKKRSFYRRWSFLFLTSDQFALAETLEFSNAQSFRHLDNLEQFIKVVIDDFGDFASRRDTNDYRSAFFNVNSVVDPFSLVLRCHWWWFTI